MIFRRHPTRWLAPYAEGLLPTAQARALAGHVLGCRRCRRTLEQVRAGQHFASVLQAGTVPSAAPSWAELAPRLDAPVARSHPPRWALVTAALAVVAVAALTARGQIGRPSVEDLALASHRAGTVEVRTDDADVVARWISARGFAFAPPPSDRHRELRGATWRDGALVLAYRLDGEPVTLVVSADEGPGRKQISRRRTGALEVATWRHDDRSYALVAAPAVNACTLCHAPDGPAALL